MIVTTTAYGTLYMKSNDEYWEVYGYGKLIKVQCRFYTPFWPLSIAAYNDGDLIGYVRLPLNWCLS